mmetsp:Transcript_12703/g.29339  ORF Transcript_12703/g.29339 Transcript_12703/m.29339 type:complete len:245 (-) Transcript_12703:575-1309(-)
MEHRFDLVVTGVSVGSVSRASCLSVAFFWRGRTWGNCPPFPYRKSRRFRFRVRCRRRWPRRFRVRCRVPCLPARLPRVVFAASQAAPERWAGGSGFCWFLRGALRRSGISVYAHHPGKHPGKNRKHRCHRARPRRASFSFCCERRQQQNAVFPSLRECPERPGPSCSWPVRCQCRCKTSSCRRCRCLCRCCCCGSRLFSGSAPGSAPSRRLVRPVWKQRSFSRSIPWIPSVPPCIRRSCFSTRC